MTEYNAGDLVEAVKGDTVIRGRLNHRAELRPTMALCCDMLYLEANGFTVTLVERATPPLPTEPGIYSDVDGDIWLLSLTRVWTILTDEHRARITDDVAPEDGAPFTRLEPVPVTAKRVLDRVRTLFGAGALILAEVDEIAAEFGVES